MRNHSSILKQQTPIKFRRNQGTSFRKISSYVNEKQQTHKTSHHSAKQTPTKRHFRTLNHHYKMEIALIKTGSEPNYHQVINNSQQQ